MQTKISHALDTNNNGVWRELRNLDLLPEQRVELRGIEPDALNSHFASVSTIHVSHECNEVISQASEDGYWFSAWRLMTLFWQWSTFGHREEVVTALHS